MRIYYIDYENVKGAGTEGIDGLSVDDRVKIFAKGKSDAMKFDDIKLIMTSKAKVVIDDVVTGTKNALDFQLLADLLVDVFDNRKANVSARYCIISKDKGYDPAILQMKKRGIDCVTRAESIGADTGSAAVRPQIQKTGNPDAQAGNVRTAKGSVQKNAGGSAASVSAVKSSAPEAQSRKVQSRKVQSTGSQTQNTNNQKAQAVKPGVRSVSEETKSQGVRSGRKPAPVAPENEGRIIREGIKAKCNIDITEPQVAHVYLALKTSDSKNAFYNYFRTAMGEVKGRAFYKSIRSSFEDLRNKIR